MFILYFSWRWSFFSDNYYLRLDPNFDEAADDGEHVADDEQNIPAIDELHSVSPAHTAAKFVFEKLHVLLVRDMEDDQ